MSLPTRNGDRQVCTTCDSLQPQTGAHRRKCRDAALHRLGVPGSGEKKRQRPERRRVTQGGAVGGGPSGPSFEDDHVNLGKKHAHPTGAFYAGHSFLSTGSAVGIAKEGDGDGDGEAEAEAEAEEGASGCLDSIGGGSGCGVGMAGSRLSGGASAGAGTGAGADSDLDSVGGNPGASGCGGGGWGMGMAGDLDHELEDSDSDSGSAVGGRSAGGAGFREEGESDLPAGLGEGRGEEDEGGHGESDESDSDVEDVDSDEDAEQAVIGCHPLLRVPLYAEMTEANSGQYRPRRLHSLAPAGHLGLAALPPFLPADLGPLAVVPYGEPARLRVDVLKACANLTTRGAYGSGMLGICNLHCAGEPPVPMVSLRCTCPVSFASSVPTLL